MRVVKYDSVEPIDFGGMTILDYTANRDSSSSLAVITVPPGGSHAEAWSKRSDKYYYVANGTIDFAVNGEPQTLSAGDFCLIEVGEHFSYRNSTDTQAVLHLFHTPSFDLNEEMFVKETKA